MLHFFNPTLGLSTLNLKNTLGVMNKLQYQLNFDKKKPKAACLSELLHYFTDTCILVIKEIRRGKKGETRLPSKDLSLKRDP